MNYLTSFLIGIIGGLLLSMFFSFRPPKKEKEPTPKKSLEKIEKELEEIKHLCRNNNLIEAEKEFFEEN